MGACAGYQTNYRIPSHTLSESLSWMKKKVGLAEPAKILAQALGY
jgi:hypothetical protein